MSSTTTTLAELLADADAAGHDHAATEKNSGLQHIHNHATGSIVWFPTWKKFRETTDWSAAVDGLTKDFSSGTAPVEESASGLLARTWRCCWAGPLLPVTPTFLCRRTWFRT
jgi:hypothetical protein